MQRDINKLRDLENGDSDKYLNANRDIIIRKQKIGDILKKDPDIKDVLGVKTPKPLNHYEDKDHPTEEELKRRNEIITYNNSIKHVQIIPWIKLNNLQTEVLNFIMFDLRSTQTYENKSRVEQNLWVYCLVHEDDMDTEFDIPRTDLLDWLVKDNLNGSNILGNQLMLYDDNFDIIDNVYYARILQFRMTTSNGTWPTNTNRYDRYTRV